MSSFIHALQRSSVERQLRDAINKAPDFLSPNTVHSSRAAGDAIEHIVGSSLRNILGSQCMEYSAAFARRAMPDIAFTDAEGFKYVVDVKTHRRDTKFNRPNVTSVYRLADLYADDTNYFMLLLISYSVAGLQASVDNVSFVPIEFLGWDCLSIGNLGKGQVQITDSRCLTINEGYSRRTWMLELCDTLLAFYPKERAKIDERIAHFNGVRASWSGRPEPG
ncbi:MAG TPA: hypothetical protein VHI13_06485 [Candidatus Kapabacteria bacterium]|nr:hypothetical protein [Candidatus Kapabacteria bacterium]